MAPSHASGGERQRLRELYLVIEFGKANHVTAATTAVAVEQALAGIHQEAWFVIGVQWAQPPSIDRG
jgi:hypothetical protein